MLLQFAVENYLSFRDRAVLSLLADPRVKHEEGHVLEGPGGRQVLRAAALYGANGSGKSNLVKALAAVQQMVHRGTRADEPLPIVPFKLDLSRRDEAHFELELVAAGKHYSYGFEATAKQVDAEWLHEIDPKGEERLLFEREAASGAPRITLGDALTADPKRHSFLEYVAQGTRQNQLFLAEAGERNVIELKPVRNAISYWDIILPDAPYLFLLDKLEKNEEFRKLIAAALKQAGTGIDDLRVAKTTLEEGVELPMGATAPNVAAQVFARLQAALRLNEQGHPELTQLLGIHRLPTGEQVELNFNEESDGTRRLLHLAAILHIMDERGADAFFAIDEIERSLHPLLTRMLIQLFFVRTGPGATAQLLFTTHDTNLLDLRVLSRDSIWFIEKDARGGSVMYPLSELDQAQVDAVEQQGKGLERGYLQGRFGAVPFFGSLEQLGLRKEQLR